MGNWAVDVYNSLSAAKTAIELVDSATNTVEVFGFMEGAHQKTFVLKGDVATTNVGNTQVKTIAVTTAANAAADTTLGTVTTQGCIIQGIVIHANTAQTANLTSCPVHGGAAKVLTFINAATAIQANLDAENKQRGWDGEVYLPIGSTIVMVHNGTGAAALDLTATIRYVAVVNGGYLA
jgi:hypothetical protein